MKLFGFTSWPAQVGVLFAVLAPALVESTGTSCTVPTGIDDVNGINYGDLNLPNDGIFRNTIITIASQPKRIWEYETPIQNHRIQAEFFVIFSAMATFEPLALDTFGRQALSDSRRRCPNTDPELLAKHRKLTLAYAYHFSFTTFDPFGLESLIDLHGTQWNMPLDICDQPEQDCSDTSTPWGLAWTLTQEILDVLSKDGWNYDGALSSTYNKVPYKDWRTNPYTPDTGCDTCWQPLEESDGLGFLYKQNHVTPHIGETGLSYFLGDADICSRTLDDPNYDYVMEGVDAIARTAFLTEQDKAEIEFFDQKLRSLAPTIAQFYARSGVDLDSWEFTLANGITIATQYEATLVVWKEKVRLDKIRPTTWIHDNFGDQEVFGYLGPDVGTSGTLAANEWQPYIRVMPHAEFPSGSSCFCSAFARSVILSTGSDDVTGAIGGPLVGTLAANSSIVEPNFPPENVQLFFNSWSELSQVCGQSRLKGGMHFAASVPAGVELCEDIGEKVYDYFHELNAGITPETAIDPDNLTPQSSRNCAVDPGTCGLNWAACTDDADSCCPDYYCEFINPNYSRCRTDPNAGCIAEHGECTDDISGCCFGTTCVGDQWYRQCVRA